MATGDFSHYGAVDIGFQLVAFLRSERRNQRLEIGINASPSGAATVNEGLADNLLITRIMEASPGGACKGRASFRMENHARPEAIFGKTF